MAKESSINDFGLLIAYVVPGFTALWGLSYVFPALRPWIGTSPAEAPTVGGFLYTTVAALAAGMSVSTLRWLILDQVHHATGIRPPKWDFAQLGSRVQAFNVLIDIHYKYYLFHGNFLISLILAYSARRTTLGIARALGWDDLGFLLLAIVLFLGSRDTLRRYYGRTGELLRARSRSK